MKKVAAPIIKQHVKALLKSNPNKDFKLQEIKEYVQDKEGETFSSGSFSGAMLSLVKEDGDIVNSSRGVYRYNAVDKRTEINNVLEEAINSLESIAMVNILELNDEEISILRSIPNMKEQIKRLMI
ncbi:hypothetical protein AXI59_17310 [Bacillus nakamurai]|uniref:hypothetical protein n=1 Tax=Bacillus nakamurai TaxID=1793963 RepID=UPI0007783DC2|nr:hypothetical protein [Bacillus nakamurai]KXZ17542.1 hypothetical protein AXI59_17310 [Bacillus nakamurai]